ncbi:MAG: phosphocholine cytidylyltransferase family protein [Lachnospiraceae bacterium]|nr:phosphocholine cytidylyltransferase family protein [Lachnospiraceae bacterium]
MANNKVERAIIMAAGKGDRMRPLTNEVPKPMVKVNGTRMIDTVIKGLLNNKITEIYVVVGYMKEKFYELRETYPEIQFIENPYFDVCNNISSLYVAREHIENAIILDGDQVIYNDEVLKKDFEKSGYNAVWTDCETNEWLMQVEEDSVTSCSRTGGKGGWQLYSVSRWSKEDAEKLKRYVEIEFIDKENRDIYWDDVAMFLHFDEFDLGIQKMQSGDVKEIDSLEELVDIDKNYKEYLMKE